MTNKSTSGSKSLGERRRKCSVFERAGQNQRCLPFGINKVCAISNRRRSLFFGSLAAKGDEQIELAGVIHQALGKGGVRAAFHGIEHLELAGQGRAASQPEGAKHAGQLMGVVPSLDSLLIGKLP